MRRQGRRMPTALMVLWIIWGAAAAVNLMVWLLVMMTVDYDVYMRPVWLLVPGAALGVVTAGVQTMRSQPGKQR